MKVYIILSYRKRQDKTKLNVKVTIFPTLIRKTRIRNYAT